MTDVNFTLGDKVKRISTGDWATIAGTSKSPLGLQYFLTIKGNFVGPIAAEDVEARDDATSGAPTPPIPPVPAVNIPDGAEGVSHTDARAVAPAATSAELLR
jgi:hypothetical protein